MTFPFACRDEYYFKNLSQDLVHLHKLYHLEKSALEVVWESEEKGVLAYSLSTSSHTLLIVINVSTQSITCALSHALSCRSENKVFIPVNTTAWELIFNSERSTYSPLFEDGDERVQVDTCPVGEGICVSIPLHWFSVRVLLAFCFCLLLNLVACSVIT